MFSFQLAYAIGLLLAGRIMDRIGVRLGFSVAVVVWSLAAVGHAAADWFSWLKEPTLHLDAATGLSVVMLASSAGDGSQADPREPPRDAHRPECGWPWQPGLFMVPSSILYRNPPDKDCLSWSPACRGIPI